MRSCSLRNRKVQGPKFILVLITPRRQPALIHFDRCGSTVKHKQSNEKFNSIVWGLTYSCEDKVSDNILSEKMNVNDWVYFVNMGAYCHAIRTPFNGFPAAKICYYIHEMDLWVIYFVFMKKFSRNFHFQL